MIKGCLQLSVAPDLEWPVDTNPVDYVSQTIVELSMLPGSVGRTFHMAHPAPFTLPKLFNWLQDFGYKTETLPYADWRKLLVADAAGPKKNALFPLLPLFLADRKSMGSMADMPTFSCVNTFSALQELADPIVESSTTSSSSEKGLKAQPLPPPGWCPMSDNLLTLYFNDYIKRGFPAPDAREEVFDMEFDIEL
jgi:thioester reductase-like protein